MSFRTIFRAAAAGIALSAPLAWAADPFPPQGIVSLSSSATVEIVRDLLNISLGTSREGTDAGVVQTQLKQALDAALAEAKKSARPGQLEVQTGAFSISPRYVKGVASGWRGSAELILEGRDMQAIGQLTGRINTLTVNRVGYAISRELREKSEGEVSAQAIARYRAKAADYAKQFGYAGYTIREVNVSGNEQPPMPRATMMEAKALSAPSDEPLSLEPGKSAVTVNVIGTVQMNR